MSNPANATWEEDHYEAVDRPNAHSINKQEEVQKTGTAEDNPCAVQANPAYWKHTRADQQELIGGYAAIKKF